MTVHPVDTAHVHPAHRTQHVTARGNRDCRKTRPHSSWAELISRGLSQASGVRALKPSLLPPFPSFCPQDSFAPRPGANLSLVGSCFENPGSGGKTRIPEQSSMGEHPSCWNGNHTALFNLQHMWSWRERAEFISLQ